MTTSKPGEGQISDVTGSLIKASKPVAVMSGKSEWMRDWRWYINDDSYSGTSFQSDKSKL